MEQVLGKEPSFKFPPFPWEVREAPFSIRRRVSWADTDPSSAYKFTAALQYVEEAEVELLRRASALDYLYPHLPRTFIEARYWTPAYFDDELIVELWIGRLGRSSIEYVFRIRRDDTVCAEGRLGTSRIREGQSAPLPEAVRSKLERYLLRECD
jgi:acyl-CoA thioester hydrolase